MPEALTGIVLPVTYTEPNTQPAQHVDYAYELCTEKFYPSPPPPCWSKASMPEASGRVERT